MKAFVKPVIAVTLIFGTTVSAAHAASPPVSGTVDQIVAQQQMLDNSAPTPGQNLTERVAVRGAVKIGEVVGGAIGSAVGLYFGGPQGALLGAGAGAVLGGVAVEWAVYQLSNGQGMWIPPQAPGVVPTR